LPAEGEKFGNRENCWNAHHISRERKGYYVMDDPVSERRISAKEMC